MLSQLPAAQPQSQPNNRYLMSVLGLFFCFLCICNFAEAKVLLPNGAGDYSLWSGSYIDVNEYPNNNGDTNYNSIALNNTRQSYNFQDSSDLGTVRGVRIVLYARVNGANPEYLRLFLYNGATISEAPDACTTINNSLYTQCSYYWSINPFTASGWSVSDLTNLQAGFRTEANGTWDSDEHRVSQIYLDVDFKTETKKIKYSLMQKLVAVSGPLDESFDFAIADPIDEVRSAFIEIGGVAQPVANVSLGVKVDNSPSTPGAYDKTYVISATGRPTNFKIIHDVTDYFKSFVTAPGGYTKYLHLNPNNNIYLLNAKLVIVYTYIIPPQIAGEYRAKAELTSSVFDTTGSGDGPAYNSIIWKGALNAGKVRFQIGTSDNDTVSNFYGSDCTNNTWYDVNPDTPAEIKCFSLHNNKRYFRYKIQICSASNCTDSGNGHPEVTDVIISWSP